MSNGAWHHKENLMVSGTIKKASCTIGLLSVFIGYIGSEGDVYDTGVAEKSWNFTIAKSEGV